MGQMDGVVTLITGVGSGLGRAIVGRFVNEGASVGVIDHDKDKLAALTDEYGGAVLTIHCPSGGDDAAAPDAARRRVPTDLCAARRQRIDARDRLIRLLGRRPGPRRPWHDPGFGNLRACELIAHGDAERCGQHRLDYLALSLRAAS
jgi:NAD(P)-dependent dehydrogenase (short-subunit alcohol dehydrogenase family)